MCVCVCDRVFVMAIQSEDVDVVCVSLDMAMASVGGFCAGKRYIIDHQRLSGLGYCFSASVPPMMSVAAVEAINILEDSNDKVTQLQTNTAALRLLLNKSVYFRLHTYVYTYSQTKLRTRLTLTVISD